MRSGLGTPPPARFLRHPEYEALDPRAFLGPIRGGIRFGQSQRGWSRPTAHASTDRPAAAVGFSPDGQAFAGAMLIVGIRRRSGSGIVGEGPTAALSWSFVSPPLTA